MKTKAKVVSKTVMYIKKHMDLRLRLPALVAWGQSLKEEAGAVGGVEPTPTEGLAYG